MDMIKVIGIALTGTFISVLLKQYRQDLGLAVSICAGGLILYFICKTSEPVLNAMSHITGRIRNGNEFLIIAAKSLGICFLTQISADICRDSGESALAGKVETAGKATLIFISVPLIMSLLDLVGELLWI